MILAALIIGLLTAYYFGIKPGVSAAVASLGLFLLAAIVPGAKLLAYALVASGLVAIFAIGPRRAPPEDAARLRRLIGGLWSQARRRLRRRS